MDIAFRYGQALFELAQEKNITQQIATDLEQLMTVLQDDVINDFLSDIFIGQSEKYSVIELLNLHPLVINLVKLVIFNHRFHLLADICQSYDSLLKKQLNIKVARIETAVALDEKQLTQIRLQLEENYQSLIEIKQIINPDLKLGFKILIDQQLYDYSISSQIKQLATQLTYRRSHE